MNREDFPILNTTVYGKKLVYLDNAATTQKPDIVINTLTKYYTEQNSNIHRGVHFLSSAATSEFEKAREAVRKFINAAYSHEIIFTRGTTESVNLVASSFGKTFINEGDEIIISEMEHHSNIVPWQFVCEERNAKLKIAHFDENGELSLEEFENLLTKKTKIVAITHVSNSLGTINPIKEIIEIAHKHGVPVLIDGAQAVAHCQVDVQQLDCDFYCFSGHKMYAPTGIGVLYGKTDLLNAMKPYHGGGEMIDKVTFEKTTFNELPFKFEAGTPSIGDVLGLQKAIEYMLATGIENIAAHESALFDYAIQELSKIEEIRFIGNAKHRAGAISFLVGDIHPYDLGVLLDHQGIAVRTGHHCTQPIMDHFKIPGTVRASFAMYNTFEEIDALVAGVQNAKKMLL